MSITQRAAAVLSGLGLAALFMAPLVADKQRGGSMPGHDMSMPMAGQMMGQSKMTTAQKIENAMSAAPESVSGAATILDWPAKEGAKQEVLRKGTNGWTCMPDMPETEGNDPMCLDEPWLQWIEAFTARKTPQISRVGIGYMMAPGGAFGSNTDPYAMKAAPDNHWGFHEPHMMIVVPQLSSLAGMSQDPMNGGPYVMFAGTPNAHIMAPTTSSKTKMMSR